MLQILVCLSYLLPLFIKLLLMFDVIFNFLINCGYHFPCFVIVNCTDLPDINILILLVLSIQSFKRRVGL